MSERITLDVIKSAVDAMGKEFDSHEIIFWLIKNHPQKYIEELYDNYRYKESPFSSFHARIANQLIQVDTKKLNKISSINVLGNISENQLWSK